MLVVSKYRLVNQSSKQAILMIYFFLKLRWIQVTLSVFSSMAVIIRTINAMGELEGVKGLDDKYYQFLSVSINISSMKYACEYDFQIEIAYEYGFG
jgi:hypothetical protein